MEAKLGACGKSCQELSPLAAGLEVNQGDTIGGTINRADVAEVVIEAALSPATENILFEVYGELRL